LRRDAPFKPSFEMGNARHIAIVNQTLASQGGLDSARARPLIFPALLLYCRNGVRAFNNINHALPEFVLEGSWLRHFGLAPVRALQPLSSLH
jgi:hypothetical protein